MPKILSYFLFILVAFQPNLTLGQLIGGGATDLGTVEWKVSLLNPEFSSEASTSLFIEATITEGWHLYAPDSPAGGGIPVVITFDNLPAGVTAGPILSLTEPIESFDPNFELEVRWFENNAQFSVNLIRDIETEVSGIISGNIQWMICNDRLCLPPKFESFSIAVNTDEQIVTQSETVQSTSVLSAGQNQHDLKNAQSNGLWSFLLIAMGAGLAALLTPCVFPMIPLTVSFFTKEAEKKGGKAVRSALVYGASIVITFTSLGVIMAIVSGAAGAQTIASNPWVNFFIGSIFLAFGFSLLGLFEIRVPNGLLNYFNKQGNEKSGYLGVIFMGLTLTLVSFSCTVPFVGALLAATAQNEWTWPVLGMLVFSSTFALPFIGFALFPNALSKLPKSGDWMNTMKVTLGFVELAAAWKFLSNADLVWGTFWISRPAVIAIWMVLFFLAGVYLLGKIKFVSYEETPKHVSPLRLMGAILFFSTTLYLLPGLLGAPLNYLDSWLPPRQASDVSLLAGMSAGGSGARTSIDEGWFSDKNEAYAEAKLLNKPLFIDFTGYTCTNCRQMETNVFPKPSVANQLENDFVLLRLYTDEAENGTKWQQFQLGLTGTVALPTYAIVDPNTETLLAQWNGLAGVEEFAQFLEQAKSLF